MDFHKLGINLSTDNKDYKVNIDLKNDIKDYYLKDIKLIITKGENTLDVSLLNYGENAVNLKSLSAHIATKFIDNKSMCVLNHEDPAKDIELKSLEESKASKEFVSYLFGTVLTEDFFSSHFWGFLSSHTSKACIKYIVKENSVEVYAIYNFGVHKLLPNETLKLDTLYMEEGNNPFNSFNNYMDIVAASHEYTQIPNLNIKRTLSSSRSNEYNILFTKNPSSYSVKKDNKPVSVKVHKEKLYPVDISTEEGKNVIFEIVQQLKERNDNIIYIKDINDYLEAIYDLKAFNPYFELSKLLLALIQRFEDIKFYSDNCPIGAAIGNNMILEQELELNRKHGMLKKFAKKKDKYSANYNFIIKVMLKRAILSYNTRFNIKNSKIRTLLETITGVTAFNSEGYSELEKIGHDIDAQSGIIPYLQNEDIFGLVARGKEGIYMAVFNLSDSPAKLYCDLSMKIGQVNLEGVINEVFTDTEYLVSNGKLYIRNFPAMECYLLKKSLA